MKKKDRFRNIRSKLTTEKGASLALALLLFMVCIVVATIIIASGSVSSGRMADMRNMDRRYYSVTSAASLVRDMVSGKDFQITQERTVKQVGAGDPTTGVVSKSDNRHMMNQASALYALGRTHDGMTGTNATWTGDDDADWELEGYGRAPVTTWNFTVKPDVSDTDKYDVTVRATLSGDTMTFVFHNSDADSGDGSDAFELEMTCRVEGMDMGSSERTVTTSGEGATATAIVVEKRTVTISWGECTIKRK